MKAIAQKSVLSDLQPISTTTVEVAKSMSDALTRWSLAQSARLADMGPADRSMQGSGHLLKVARIETSLITIHGCIAPRRSLKLSFCTVVALLLVHYHHLVKKEATAHVVRFDISHSEQRRVCAGAGAMQTCVYAERGVEQEYTVAVAD